MNTQTSTPDPDIRAWFAGRLPDQWFQGPAEITVDREEITVIGTLSDVELADTEEVGRVTAREARISRFREETRQERMRVADEAESRFERKVSWGARCGETTKLFTTISMPIMTRLRQSERLVLDVLVDAGVARSRSEALAWCVRLVGKNESQWIDSLRDALVAVEKARAEGPGST